MDCPWEGRWGCVAAPRREVGLWGCLGEGRWGLGLPLGREVGLCDCPEKGGRVVWLPREGR